MITQEKYDEIVNALIEAGFEVKDHSSISNSEAVLRVGHKSSQTYSYIRKDHLSTFYIGMTMMNSVMRKQSIYDLIQDGAVKLENVGPILDKDELQARADADAINETHDA